jgi:hypothetical protein
MKTVKKQRTKFAPQPGAGGINRYKIGNTPRQNFTPKETSPGVLSIPIGKSKPSRPQLRERMSVGGRKGKAKGRTDPKAADPKDPGQAPYPSLKKHWPTKSKLAKKGYVVGKAWPEDSRISSIYAANAQEGVGADGPF